MDNVNLSDNEAGSPSVTDQANALRGRRFTNGEVITTVLPVYNRFPWVMPAVFRPELVPEDLMAPILTVSCFGILISGMTKILNEFYHYS